MTHQPFNVLFLCTGNSARSILAEALLNHLGQGRFKAYSAGSSPRENQRPNPLAIETLVKAGLPVDGLFSKSWDEFAKPGAPTMDYIFTVCDQAAGEVCPFWPGKPASAHWGFPDPSQVSGSDEDKRKAFRDVMNGLKKRLDVLASLPLDRLDSMVLKKIHSTL